MGTEFFNPINLPQEKRKYFVELLINSPGIDLNTNAQIVAHTPFMQEAPDKMENLITQVNNINRILPGIKTETDHVFQSFLEENLGIEGSGQSIPNLLDNLIAQNDSTKTAKVLFGIHLIYHTYSDKFIGSEMSKKDDVFVATNHLAINLVTQIHQKTENEDIKKTSKSYLLYFIALQSLMLGAKTNAHLFAYSPDTVDIENLKEVILTIRMENVDEIKKEITANVFEGKQASPIKGYGDGQNFTRIEPRDEDL